MNPDNIESNQTRIIFHHFETEHSSQMNFQCHLTLQKKNFIKYKQVWKPIRHFWVTSWPLTEGSHKLDLQEHYRNHKCFQLTLLKAWFYISLIKIPSHFIPFPSPIFCKRRWTTLTQLLPKITPYITSTLNFRLKKKKKKD